MPATTVIVGWLLLTYAPYLSLPSWLGVGGVILVLVARFLRHPADR